MRVTRALALAGAMLGLEACNKPEKEAKSQEAVKPVATETQERQKAEAEKMLENFPTEIPGAVHVSIDKSQIEGAKKAMVVVRYHHINPAPKFTQLSPAELYWELNTVDQAQRNTEKIISFLKEKYGIDSVLTENILDEQIDNSTNSVSEDFRTYHSDLLTMYYLHMNPPGFNTHLTKEEMEEKFSYTIGATIKMFEDGKISLQSAEDRETWDKLDSAAVGLNNLAKGDHEGYLRREDVPKELQDEWDRLYHDREEKLMDKIEQNPKTMSVVLFGSGHDWRDNVREHNKSAKEKIGLVVITPEIKNDSFVTNVLLNAGFSDDEDDWIEFHFRDYIEELEKNKKVDPLLFKRGREEISASKERNGLTEEQIKRAVDIIIDRSEVEIKK